ncbi:hypothetical protein ACFRAR_17445 [Kitasatospora sp. NPDC056651]|uniref:hypothetical protein n=1 Tax=Kitasatospora sp. NPDC056651 TaxID=3345892 RepID=UPI00368EA88B
MTSAWGLVMGGLLLLGRTPARPLAVASVASVAALAWALPSAVLAAGVPLPWVAVGALVAGAGPAVCGALYNTTTQRWVPTELLGRLTAFGVLDAFCLGPLGLAAAGPPADRFGSGTVLLLGSVWQLAAGAVVLAAPAVRNRRWEEGPGS